MTTISILQKKDTLAALMNVWRFALGIALSALSGLMLLLAFPPYGLWPLAWFALVPGLLAQYRLLPARWTSLAAALYSLVWLGPFLARLFGDMGPFFQYLGVWIAILNFFVSKDRKFHETTGYRWFIPGGVLAWVGFEMIRATFIPVIATSAFIGYTQATQPWLIQPVSIFSVYGLNLMILLFNYSLAQGAMHLLDRKWSAADVVSVDGRDTRRWLTGTGIGLAAWVALSLVLLLARPGSTSNVRVATLRPGYPLPAFQDEVNTSEVRFNTFAGQAREAAAQGAKIIYTPEMSFNFDPQLEYTEEFRALAQETGAYIYITYAVAIEGQPWRNEAVMLSPDGQFSPVYGKNHTWGIGEPPTASAGNFIVNDTPLGKLATLICHDANYTDIARKLVANGAQIIAAPYREFGGFGEQAWTNALFRAVENETAVVVSGVNSVSAIINADGSIVALDTDISGSSLTMVGDVTPGTGRKTIYTLLGDVIGWLALAGYIFMMIFQSRVEKRLKQAAKSGQV